MDGQHFDLISKWLATRGSRRATLRGLAAGALVLGLGRLSLDAALADCKKLGQKCATNGDCCAGAQCKGNKCVCKRGNSSCGDHLCCPPDRVCVGVSSPSIDPQSDPVYKCICPDGFEEDADGNCACPSPCGEFCCEEKYGEVCCGSRRGKKQCALLDSSPRNCGECGNVCPKDRICQNGKCVCPPTTCDIEGVCVHLNDLNDDHDNCGACGHQCPSNRVCLGGECVYQCEGTTVPEGGCCSDIDCWAHGEDFYCCSGPGCDYFDSCAFGCVDDSSAEGGGGLDGFIICSVL